MTRTHKLTQDTRGASLVEYILVLGCVALVAIAGYRIFGNTTKDTTERMGDKVASLQAAQAGQLNLAGYGVPANGTMPASNGKIVTGLGDPPAEGTPTPTAGGTPTPTPIATPTANATPTAGGNPLPVATPVPVPAPTPVDPNLVLMAQIGLPSGGDRPFVPPKRWDGKPIRGGGYRDADGNVWKPDPSGHGGPHWDVTHPKGGHTNVDENGKVTHGGDNFPKAPKPSQSVSIDPVPIAVGGGILATIAAGWWAAKIASPACGPAVLVCAIVF